MENYKMFYELDSVVEERKEYTKGLVSVIVPVYNTENYLEQCINSLLNQAYKNIEIIAIENASKDGCLRILKRYMNEDERVRVIVKKKNESAGKSRNIGLDYAKGEYICFVDSDDYVEHNFIEVMVEQLEKNKNINIAQCCYWTFDEYGDEKDTLPYKETKFYEGRDLCVFMSDFVGLCGPNVMLWNKIYRHSVFEDVRFPEGMAYEDMQLTYKILYKEKEVLWIRNRLIHWRKNYSSGTSSSNYREFYLDEIRAYISRLNFFREKDDKELYRLTLKRLYYVSAQHMYLYSKYINDKQSVLKQTEWLKGIINRSYVELMKMDWPWYTRRRMRFIKLFPMKFGEISTKRRLDLSK